MGYNIWTAPTKPLTEIVTNIVDNRGRVAPESDSGHKLIATNCIYNTKLYPTYEKIRFVNDETYLNWFRAHPLPGDIIFVCKGTPGKVCLVPDPIDFCIAQDMVALRCNPDIVYNRYLLAVLRSREIQWQIYNTSVGDVIPHFKKSFFPLLEIPIPPMNIQRTIGDIYFNLSEKQEHNQKMNDTLAELLDVQFDSLIETESEGWESASLLDIASYKNGLAMQRFRPAGDDPGLPVLKIRELGQGYCGSDAERCRSDIDESVTVHDGDLVFSWSGTLLLDFWAGGDAGLNQHLFKVTSERYPSWFYYMWTKQHMRRFIALAKDRATTMGHIKRSALQESEVFIPPTTQMAELTAQMQPFVDEIVGLKVQSRKLGELRDALLPKLMSGEIDVSDVVLPMLPNKHLSV